MRNRVSVDPEDSTVSATRTIRSSGNSTVLTIPPQLLEAIGLEVSDEVRLVAHMDTGELVIKAASQG
jgi:antitoxin component of MazEF toxin-antitoxin module